MKKTAPLSFSLLLIGVLLAGASPLSAQPPQELRVTWLGTATVHIDDGQHALMTDGFFSRPSLLRVATDLLEPNPGRIDAALEQAGIGRLEAVLVLHSHHDHAMDAPVVAQRTGALVAGSSSTANVSRGGGLPESRILVPEEGRILEFGDFRVKMISSAHAPMPTPVARLSGHNRMIETPLEPPAPVSAWKEGGSYLLWVEHPQGNLVIQASAGFRGGELDGHDVDIALLSTAGLGRQSMQHQDNYFHEMVVRPNAHTVVPIHWDNFFRPLSPGTPPLGWPLENHAASMEALVRNAAEQERELVRIETMETLRIREGRIVP